MDMAKNAGDLILRDRMQFDLSAQGDRTTLYGRFDLSEYVNTLQKKGLSIKEVRWQLRRPGDGNVGAAHLIKDLGANASPTNVQVGSLKLFATTRAYENAADVGIASPDVLAVEQWDFTQGQQILAYDGAGAIVGCGSAWLDVQHYYFGTPDLHREGYTVISDLLIGVAADKWTAEADQTLELDVMLIAQPVSITQSMLTEMLVQGADN